MICNAVQVILESDEAKRAVWEFEGVDGGRGSWRVKWISGGSLGAIGLV